MARSPTAHHEMISLETEILIAARRMIALEGEIHKHTIPLAAHGYLSWAHGILASWHEGQRLRDPSLR